MHSKPPRGWCSSILRTEVIIERVTQLEPHELEGLVRCSLEEGFKFVQRLRDEYESGVSGFDRHGEALLLARDAQRVTAVIGLSLDPQGQPGVMRVRRFYVLPEHRGHGLGRKLLIEVIELARAARAQILELHTDNPQAERFYERNGFQRLDSRNPTHRLEL
jgi:GNAT superfamily N-acetyltransferase